MTGSLVLAYLGGLFDGDGYFKLTKNFRSPRIVHPYYANVLGIAQLWPGDSVRLFAQVFGGEVKLVVTKKGTAIARCELRTARAEAATRRMIPFLLVKRRQALLFLEVPRVRPRRRGRTLPTEHGHESLERIKVTLDRIQEGSWTPGTGNMPLSEALCGYENLGPVELGWTYHQLLAYLAGIMDSDGNFRIERKRVDGMRWPHYRINARCAQAAPSSAIDLLALAFGGQVTTAKERRPNCRDLAAWSIHDRAAFPAIKALLPFLRLKWTDACLLLELRELKSQGKHDLTLWHHRNRWQRVIPMHKRSYSAKQVAEFEQVRQALLALHRNKVIRGPNGPAMQG